MLYDEREYLFFERRIAVKKKVMTKDEWNGNGKKDEEYFFCVGEG